MKRAKMSTLFNYLVDNNFNFVITDSRSEKDFIILEKDDIIESEMSRGGNSIGTEKE